MVACVGKEHILHSGASVSLAYLQIRLKRCVRTCSEGIEVAAGNKGFVVLILRIFYRKAVTLFGYAFQVDELLRYRFLQAVQRKH